MQNLLKILNKQVEVISNCKISLIYDHFQNNFKNKYLPLDLHFDALAKSNMFVAHSGGISLTVLTEANQYNTNSTSPFPSRVPRTLSSTAMCTTVILIVPLERLQSKDDQSYFGNILFTPLLNPPFIANQDKFIVISYSGNANNLLESTFLKQIKYKILILTAPVSQVKSLQIYQFCYYCTHKVIQIISFSSSAGSELTETRNMFPDFELNYFGSVLRVSSTDKLPGVFEIVTLPNGKNIAKGGFQATALFHVMSSLNFTYDLYKSGAKGSTGHRLPNGTWVGTVGEVFSNEVDVGMACSMTLIRHFVVDLVAPISFEYVNFAVGPPVTIYSVLSLFWPFSTYLWAAIFICTLITVVVSTYILHYAQLLPQNCYTDLKWTGVTILKYFGSTWIEQSNTIPERLPQSIKIILGYWLLFCVVGTNIYKAKMVSFMTFPVTDPIPTTFDELADSSYDIVFHYFGSVALNTFKESHSPTYTKILGRMTKEPNPMKCLLNTMSFSGESSGKACILFGASYRAIINKNLSDAFGVSPISRNPNTGFMFTPGIISRKSAVFSPNFKHILSSSLQMGLHDYWDKCVLNTYLEGKNDWLRETKQNQLDYGIVRISGEVENDGNVHMKHLKGPIACIIVGLNLALVVFIGEVVWRMGQTVVKEKGPICIGNY